MPVRRPFPCLALLALTLLILAPSEARAQHDDPVGPFVIDAHVAFPSLSSSDSVAAAYGFRPDQLPERALGFQIGAHVYPWHMRRTALGLGATLLRGRGQQVPGEDATPTDPTVESRVSALTPQISLNFGTARGWSYISAGYGWTRRTTGDAATTIESGPSLATLSYGGGARWFLAAHVAFSFDLRFYRLPTQDADVNVPAVPGYTMFVGTAGISFK